MTQALFTSMTGLNAGTEQLKVVSDNVANMNTTAYKTSRVDFQDIWYQTKTTGTNSTKVMGGTNPYQIGVGVQCAAITKDFSAASTTTTGLSTDLAITGSGWFCVQNSDGATLYTRDGNFSLDEEGYLVTSAGYKVLGMSTITSSVGSTTPIRVPTQIKVVEEPTNADLFKKLPLDSLNCCETITSGDFIVTVDNVEYTFNLNIQNPSTVDVEELVTTLNGLTGTAADGTTIAMNDLYNFEAKDGVITATNQGNHNQQGFAAATQNGTNFLKQTGILGAKEDENGVISSVTMNMSASITTVDDVTADETKLYKSFSFGDDGLMTVTYSDSSTLTVQANEAGYTYFKYEDAAGVIIEGDINNSADASLYVDPNLLTTANMQLQIAKVTNDNGMVAVGSNCYQVGVNCGDIIYTAANTNGTGAIVQGALESSNVDLAEQFSYMILAQRLVQANSQVFNSANSMLETLVYLGQ